MNNDITSILSDIKMIIFPIHNVAQCHCTERIWMKVETNFV